MPNNPDGVEFYCMQYDEIAKVFMIYNYLQLDYFQIYLQFLIRAEYLPMEEIYHLWICESYGLQ